MKEEIAQKLLKKVKESYNIISGDFSATRGYIWPDLEIFGKYIKAGDKVLDLGCGNGRLYDFLKNKSINYFGVDNSEALINEAKKKYPEIADKFQVGDALDLNFPDNHFDAVMMVAVLNHLPSKELRLQVLNNVKRVLKPDGYLLMTNWNLYQKKYRPLIIKYSLLKLIGKSPLDFGDCLVPFGQEKVKRYYHSFTKKEIQKLAVLSGLTILENYYSLKGTKGHWFTGKNLVSILQK
ncbi:MAG: class I SAM-dependent methyltransferase [Patescibacteria group bacterium]|nr:class I SAM-dependent methyltransferase [Patescibacteria group bacterium]MDD5490530.1 class I SAM-dependent methyltransferase [Patescibacteria group bacterium]